MDLLNYIANLAYQQVTIPAVTIDLGKIVTWMIIGLIAGFLAGLIVRGRRYGLLTAIIVGLVGALIGGFLLSVVRIPALAVFDQPIPIRWIDIISAFIGALILLLILSLLYRRT
jgi:uncharacterized membrane protein YeaQ/YmgE (transglycosylase-associated protein family)